ncbi:hypothetical protein EV2_018690 [Malus domestica]
MSIPDEKTTNPASTDLIQRTGLKPRDLSRENSIPPQRYPVALKFSLQEQLELANWASNFLSKEHERGTKCKKINKVWNFMHKLSHISRKF